MLNNYLAAVTNLLQMPAAPNALYSTAALTAFINVARGQVAGEAACIRFVTSLTLQQGTQQYGFSLINLPFNSGVGGILNVRTVWYVPIDGGLIWLTPTSFESFSVIELNTPNPPAGQPVTWAQLGQGNYGTIWLSPTPAYPATSIQVDCAAFPIPLVDDGTPEAIPYYWVDAVPYFAAYLALLSAQAGIRTQEADQMYKRYEEFVERARRAATPAVLPWLFEQTMVPGGINPQPRGGG